MITPGLARARRVVADSESFRGAGREALEHDVRPLEESPGDLGGALVLHVEGQAALRGVELAEELRPVPARLIVLVGARRAQIVGAGRRLDANHVGAVVGEIFARDRTDADPAEVGDLEPFEGQGGSRRRRVRAAGAAACAAHARAPRGSPACALRAAARGDRISKAVVEDRAKAPGARTRSPEASSISSK